MGTPLSTTEYMFSQPHKGSSVDILTSIEIKAESDLNFNYPINCSVKSTIFRLISYSVYSLAMPEI